MSDDRTRSRPGASGDGTRPRASEGEPGHAGDDESRPAASDRESPWPERERTQLLLLFAGAAFLLPGGLRLVDLAWFGGTVVVGCAAVASALLVYGLLGWAGTRVEDGEFPAPGE